MRFKEQAKNMALATGLYRLIRTLIGSKETRLARTNMGELISSLLPNGSLVFDIGADIGAFSEVYARAGFKVVAVEPNPQSAARLRLMTDGLPVSVVEAAVGAKCGLATLHISEKIAPTSTLSNSFMTRMEDSNEKFKGNWHRRLVVPTVTLDTLVTHFGQPAYIKIDVEGYEIEVLRGLSSQPPLLSFEYHDADLQAAYECVDRFLPDSEFNRITNSGWGYHEKLDFKKWLSRENLKNELSALSKSNIEGDIFVRRNGSSN